ncbi:DNA polymerase III subunit delta [Corallincola platygyrae]|uniref:DNA polymerase III subunit delta n=1 Tax=Corallincola platygyrae TaxID=1193278 RepID=A0ABW4XRX3_9GAMM
MQCYPEQLSNQLSQGLSPIYLLFGDEPLQKLEALAEIRSTGQQHGITELQRFSVDTSFDWQQFTQSSSNLSLFSQGEILEVELTTGSPGREGGQWLQEYASNPPADQVLVLHGPRLNKDKQKAKWFKSISAAGTQVSINLPTGQQWQRWLTNRANRYSVTLQPDALQLLLGQCEGNLLAADQELQKLSLLHGQQAISIDLIQESLANHSRHNIFQLTDALLSGDLERATNVLESLQGEGIEPVVISWAISKEVLLLKQLSQQPRIDSREMMKLGIWQQRQALVKQALQRLHRDHLNELVARCADFDSGIKLGTLEHPWTWLHHLAVMFGGSWKTQAGFEITS